MVSVLHVALIVLLTGQLVMGDSVILLPTSRYKRLTSEEKTGNIYIGNGRLRLLKKRSKIAVPRFIPNRRVAILRVEEICTKYWMKGKKIDGLIKISIFKPNGTGMTWFYVLVNNKNLSLSQTENYVVKQVSIIQYQVSSIFSWTVFSGLLSSSFNRMSGTLSKPDLSCSSILPSYLHTTKRDERRVGHFSPKRFTLNLKPRGASNLQKLIRLQLSNPAARVHIIQYPCGVCMYQCVWRTGGPTRLGFELAIDINITLVLSLIILTKIPS